MFRHQTLRVVVAQILILLSVCISGTIFSVQQVAGYTGYFEEGFTDTSYKDFTSTTIAGWENDSGMISLPRIFPEYGASSLSLNSMSLAVKDNYVYLAKDQGGLEIFDISDPTSPESVATYSGNASVDVITVGDYLYQASYYYDTDITSYFSIFNVSDPVNPTLIGSLSRPFNSTFWIVMNSLFIINDWAYVIEGNWNLTNFKVSYSITNINITDPSTPSVFSTYVIPSIFDGQTFMKEIFIEGHYLFFPEEFHGLLVFDIIDPANITLSGNYTTGGFPTSVFIEQDIAYVVDSDQGLHVFNVSDPTNASFLTTIPTTFNSLFYQAYTVWVENKFAYLHYKRAGFLGRFQVIDLSDPLNPMLVFSTQLSEYASEYAIFKDHSYIYLCGSALTILDAGHYVSTAVAQSITTVYSLNSTLFDSVVVTLVSNVPPNTTIDFFLSSDAGVHWEQTSANNGVFIHSFTFQGSELRWRAIFHTSNDSLSPSISFISFNSDIRIRATALLSPFNGFMTFDNSPTFVWEDLLDASGYTIQIDRTPYFNSTSFQSMYIESSSYTVIFEESPPHVMYELTPGTWYWRIGAHDIDGILGTFSFPYRILIDSITHPEDFNLSVGSVGHSITWFPLASNPDSFQILRNGIWIAGGEWTGESITINIDNLPLGCYNFTCIAFASSGDNMSDMVTVSVTEPQNITPSIIDPPQNLNATAGELSVYLNWNPPINNGGSPVTGYRVYRGTSSGEYTLIFITSDTAFIDTLVTENITYYYMVTAINSVGESLSSNEVTATPLLPTSPSTTTSLSSATTTSSMSESMSDSTTTQAEAGSFSQLYVIIIFLCTITIYGRKRKKG